MSLSEQKRSEIWGEILTRYSEPHRHYHTVQHLYECLREFETSKHLATDPLALELALWFHDAIYDPKRYDNEEASAAIARQKLKGVISEDAVAVVETLISATKHNFIPREPDAQLIVDIDLAILGQPVLRFDEYEIQVRREYEFVPEKVFYEKRAEILEQFLARPQIYNTSFFRDCYAAAARENLARSIKRLRA
jgi:predicted metal-dependent HD superfamily phosphohydrolase